MRRHLLNGRSEGQRVELLGVGQGWAFGGDHLPLADHVHGLEASQQSVCRPERFETQHRPGLSLYRPVVLLDQVVQVFRLTQADAQAGVGLVSKNE